MSYDGGAENFALLRRTIIDTFDFSGRSRRTEVIYYWFASAIINTVIGFAVSTSLPWSASLTVRLMVNILLILPLFALFTRRLHDQDRSGWWTLILLLIVGLNIVKSLGFMFGDAEPFPENYLGSLGLWIGLPFAIGFLVLTFLPGVNGPNNFGPDPRLS